MATKWQVAKVSTTTGRIIKRVGTTTEDREVAEIWRRGWMEDPRFPRTSGRWIFRVVEAK
jgi:hypothetical protein